jgi:SAM-dependent methyltransferase
MNNTGEALYDDEFFDRHTDETLQSARIVVPHVLRKVRPNSVIDVGCALGAWLRVFAEHGVQTVQGLDGHYVDRSKLLIEKTDFTPVNLAESIRSDLGPVTEKANGRYDLAVCLEVAEHLPDSSAPDLVRTLTTLAPVVLFSAAVPGQGGVGHINEQWPGYWRSRFQKHGFQRLDPIRRRIWKDERVHWWYRQNIFLFAAQEKVAASERLSDEERLAALEILYLYCLNGLRRLKGGMKVIPRALLQAMKHRQAGSCRKGQRFRSWAPKNR